MKDFHVVLPRVFNRVPFIAYRKGELEVGLGKYCVLMGRWFIALNV